MSLFSANLPSPIRPPAAAIQGASERPASKLVDATDQDLGIARCLDPKPVSSRGLTRTISRESLSRLSQKARSFLFKADSKIIKAYRDESEVISFDEAILLDAPGEIFTELVRASDGRAGRPSEDITDLSKYTGSRNY